MRGLSRYYTGSKELERAVKWVEKEDQVKLITSPKLFQDVLTPLIFSTLALLLDQTVALPALRSLIGSSMVLRVLPAPDGPRST